MVVPVVTACALRDVSANCSRVSRQLFRAITVSARVKELSVAQAQDAEEKEQERSSVGLRGMRTVYPKGTTCH